MKTQFLLINIILLSPCSLIKGEGGSDDLTCDHLEDYKGHFAGHGDKCDSIEKVAVEGSCTSYKACYQPTGSKVFMLTSEAQCPENEIFNVVNRRCQPGKTSDNCPQIKCFPHGKNDVTTPIYSTPEPVTTRSSSSGHINNTGSTLTGIFTFSITLNVITILMSRIM